MSSHEPYKMKMGRSLLAALALSASVVSNSYADATDQLISSGAARAKASAASQARVDQISDNIEKVFRKYQQESKVVENLKAYNDRMRRTLTAQEKAIVDLERSIEDASLIERQIVPLMMRMIEGLDRFVAADLPFEREKRLERVERIRGYLTNANISAAERFRQVLQAYSIEAGYGKTLNVYTDTLTVDGEELSVNVLQVGRTGLYFQTLDGSRSGHWNKSAGVWEELGSSHDDGINHAIRVVQGKEPAESLLKLPVAAPEAS